MSTTPRPQKPRATSSSRRANSEIRARAIHQRYLQLTQVPDARLGRTRTHAEAVAMIADEFTLSIHTIEANYLKNRYKYNLNLPESPKIDTLKI